MFNSSSIVDNQFYRIFPLPIWEHSLFYWFVNNLDFIIYIFLYFVSKIEIAMEDNINTIVESERSTPEEQIDSHCKVLIGTAKFFKNFFYVSSVFFFIGIMILVVEYLDKNTSMNNGIPLIAFLVSSFITIMNVLLVRGLYAFINVIAEIARNTREIKSK